MTTLASLPADKILRPHGQTSIRHGRACPGAISIRVDEDVLDWFKGEGAGYQRRINAVLRSYVEQRKKKRA